MASLVTTSRMQQCFNVLIDIYHEFLLLFYCCVLLEIKLTTTTTTTWLYGYVSDWTLNVCVWFNAVLPEAERYLCKFDSLAPGRCGFNHNSHFTDSQHEHFLWNCPPLNVIRPYWWLVTIGSGSILMPAGNKSLPEPLLTQISIAIWSYIYVFCRKWFYFD